MTGVTEQAKPATQLGPPGWAGKVRMACWVDRRFGGLSPAFWQLFWDTGIARLGWVVIPFRTFYLAHQRHLDAEQVSLILLAFGVGWAVSQPIGGWFADRLGRRVVILASAFGSAGAYLFFGATAGFVSLAVSAGTDLATCYATYPGSLTSVDHLYPAAHQSRISHPACRHTYLRTL